MYSTSNEPKAQTSDCRDGEIQASRVSVLQVLDITLTKPLENFKTC